MILLTNGNMFGPDFIFCDDDVLVEEGWIIALGQDAREIFLSSENHEKEQLDLSGSLLLPGLIDIHVHGCAGYDTCDASLEALSAMSSYLAQNGITSFLPTTMTMPAHELSDTVSAVNDFMRSDRMISKALGIHIEGPFLSPKFAGIQSLNDLRDPSIAEIRSLQSEYPDIIRIIDVAPELPGAREFIQELRSECTISFAHSDTDYETAMMSFTDGISHVTHLFNAMRGMAHRSPGAVGAVFDNEHVTAELICDGYHIHPAVLRTAFRLLGEDRSVIVSDSMRAAGCPDGVYSLGGQPVIVYGGRTFNADRGPAGSVTNVFQEMKNLLSYGVPLRQIIKSATINPARVIGKDHEIGSIAKGKKADLITVDKDLTLQWTMIEGKFVPVC
jgi:N-acetylglucosamine-6-phosphate deacetylase